MALYSGSLSPLQTGEQCLLHVEASHHPHAWKGHMAACPSALGYSKISAAQKTLAFLCGILGTVNGCQTQSLYPLEEGACGEAWPLVSLAGPVGELSTVPSVKRDFTPEGGPPSSLWKISRLSALPTEYSKMHGRGSWRKRWTSHYDFGHNLLKARGGQLCSLLSVSLSFFGLHRDLVVSHGLL